ncbi:MAG TPA: WXG100 family type VII secretion target [Candidatus Monoglobus merdigallinarum]|uniref:WXG100 family type VII secretion target n=1 Tax=Candidatus Monoglobus merdigallinarum TaxID=2838698 RepID=A0A9D1TMA7_9FIRM|nr:WXG100 family type VII secretion target [Candidatus Monoglobus merdigallinarum]
MNIKFEYEAAMRAVRELEDIADTLDKNAKSRLNEAVENVRSAWEGENASGFQTKGRQLSEKLEKSIGNLRKTADTIRAIAQKMLETEEQAKETAKVSG